MYGEPKRVCRFLVLLEPRYGVSKTTHVGVSEPTDPQMDQEQKRILKLWTPPKKKPFIIFSNSHGSLQRLAVMGESLRASASQIRGALLALEAGTTTVDDINHALPIIRDLP